MQPPALALCSVALKTSYTPCCCGEGSVRVQQSPATVHAMHCTGNVEASTTVCRVTLPVAPPALHSALHTVFAEAVGLRATCSATSDLAGQARRERVTGRQPGSHNILVGSCTHWQLQPPLPFTCTSAALLPLLAWGCCQLSL